jgi:hypothetical protein
MISDMPPRPASPIRRAPVWLGLVTADGTETGRVVRGRLTSFVATMTFAYTVVAGTCWYLYAVAGHGAVMVPIFWSALALWMIVVSVRRASTGPENYDVR